jgi:hypothetical protein
MKSSSETLGHGHFYQGCVAVIKGVDSLGRLLKRRSES